ncbi:hypothetical protein BROUX41_001498 [Berkeleyomyces rouxiae]|uniref:uncharacterized protein n=1 Tax=Berkeleyomyces rouxiae TaxID=2035830 RepID=UPI003B776045
MLDENLPTFRGRQSAENPLNTLFSFTHHGSTPSPEFLLRRLDPTDSESKNKYAVALADPVLNDVVYAEVLVTPEWKQSSALDGVSGGTTDPTPPENINLQLYNPDQTIVLRQVPGSWGRGGSWDFELPTVAFKKPTSSQIDREATSGPAARDLIPRLTFRWKRERLSKGMTCYLIGKTEDSASGRRGTKEPDITVALAEQGRNGDTLVALYEPNMRRVELEDRKGFDMILLLSLEVIRDLFLSPKDPYNLDGRGARGRRASQSAATLVAGASHSPPANGSAPNKLTDGKCSKTPPPVAAATVATVAPSSRPSKKPKTPSPVRQSQAEIDAETERLKAMVEQEEREREEERKREREREEKRRREEEERKKREREAEVERETERLRQLYGIEGQDFSSGNTSTSQPASPPGDSSTPILPPRPVSMGPSQFQAQTQSPGSGSGHPRPLSAYQQHFTQSHFQPPPGQAPAQGNSKPNPFASLSNKLESLPLAGQAASTVQGFLGKIKRDDKKTTKKTT